MMAARLRVLVIASDRLARTGLALLLDEQTTCEVVGQIGGAASLPDDADLYGPDVIIWDAGWEAVDAVGLEALDQAGYPVVMLVADEPGAVQAYHSGAAGLLLRDSVPERISAALEAVARGLIVIDPAVSGTLLPEPHTTLDAPLDDLTPREMDVLLLIAEGLSNRAIAQELDISEHTVKFHITAIMSKLNAQSRTDAVVRAARLRLIYL